MIRRLAGFFTAIVQKYLPDAYLFAVFLTFIIFILGVVAEGQTPLAMVNYWGGGLWKLLGFSMQMVLILVTGHTLAKTKLVAKGLTKLASIPKTPTQAIIAASLMGLVGSWLNWGFGLIVGGIFAQELARKVKGCHYGLLVASAYSGFIVWHAGLSASIPLAVATGSGFLASILDGKVIPVSQTLFSAQTLSIIIILLITLPILNVFMAPKKEDTVEFVPPVDEVTEEKFVPSTPAEHLENSRTVSIITFALGAAYVINHFAKGGSMGLDIVNLIFLSLGILLHGTPRKFLRAFTEGVKGSAGIVLQFPFYAGIMGMMVGSGLAASMSNFFVNISTPATFPLFTYLSAGIVNFFVPSGGGQWAVQGPIVIPAAKALGVDLAKASMAIAWGDAWTNMVQPFWALPMLGIAGLGIRDIMGFCTVTLIWSGIVTSLMLFIM